MKIYTINDDYINFLKIYDSKVPDNKNGERPYIGIVISINELKYYAPLTSPKKKHLTMKNGKDFRKINNGIFGAINFNNMIPVLDSQIKLKDIKNETDLQYKILLNNQLRYINNDSAAIFKTANNLRMLCLKDDKELSPFELTIKNRCCNFKILESVYKDFKYIK